MKNKIIFLSDMEYIIEDMRKDCIDVEEIQNLFTDYFYDFDYILGDYSYNKLRLKGFYDSKNKKAKSINNIKEYKKYIDSFCSPDCPYFLIKKKISIEKNK